jgi:lipopolysaccharide transport protein LptA
MKPGIRWSRGLLATAVAGSALGSAWLARPLLAAPPAPKPAAKPPADQPKPPAAPAAARLQPQPVQVPAPKPEDPSQDTIIDADKQDFDQVARRWTLVGNVSVQSPKAHMTADRMVVQFTEQNEILWAKATGNVKLQSKGEEGRRMTGTGEEGEYFEQEQKANLVGNVVLHFVSPSLEEPATITGARADVDLKTQQAVVSRAPREQVRTIVRPKNRAGGSTAPMRENGNPPAQQAPPGGSSGSAPSEPIELTSDRVEADGRANSYVATGNPVMVQGTRRIAAEKLWFNVDPDTSDLREARAVNDVVFDGIAEDGGRLHATGDTGVFDGTTGVLTVTSNPGSQVLALQTPKDGDKPYQLSGQMFVYDTRTKAHSVQGRARVVLPRAPKPGSSTSSGSRAGSGNR